MPTPTYIPLATYTVTGSPDASILFSSIPATYRDLILVCNGGANSGNRNVSLTLNADINNANYPTVQMSGTGATTDSTVVTTRIINYYGYPEADLNNVIRLQLFDYSATNKHKTYLSRSDHFNNGTAVVAGRWANNAAVTSIQIDMIADSFRVGTTASLYGIA